MNHLRILISVGPLALINETQSQDYSYQTFSLTLKNAFLSMWPLVLILHAR